MKRAYRVVERKDSEALTEFLPGEGPALVPFVELIQQTELAVDELVVAAERSAIEAVLTLSAQQIAGPKHAGRRIPRPGAFGCKRVPAFRATAPAPGPFPWKNEGGWKLI